jgi:non-homologous end joining protein Ku
MEKVGRAALAENGEHEKKSCAHPRGQGELITQVMYYANEIRDFGPKNEQEKLDAEEIDLASGLIIRRIPAGTLYGEYRERVLAMLEKKRKGSKKRWHRRRHRPDPLLICWNRLSGE